MEEVTFGKYALPLILMVGLSLIYRIFEAIPNRFKPLIAIILGIGLGIVAMFYNGIPPVFKNIVDYVLYGFMAGCSAVGLWEGLSAVRNGSIKPIKSILILMTIGTLTISVASCSSIQSGAIKAGQIDLKNATATRQLAKDLLSTWKLNSGFIRGALGPKIAELPNQAIEAMKELDALAEKTDVNDYDLGYSLGARIRMLSSIVIEAFKLYSPEILKFVPSVLAI